MPLEPVQVNISYNQLQTTLSNTFTCTVSSRSKSRMKRMGEHMGRVLLLPFTLLADLLAAVPPLSLALKLICRYFNVLDV